MCVTCSASSKATPLDWPELPRQFGMTLSGETLQFPVLKETKCFVVENIKPNSFIDMKSGSCIFAANNITFQSPQELSSYLRNPDIQYVTIKFLSLENGLYSPKQQEIFKRFSFVLNLDKMTLEKAICIDKITIAEISAKRLSRGMDVLADPKVGKMSSDEAKKYYDKYIILPAPEVNTTINRAIRSC